MHSVVIATYVKEFASGKSVKFVRHKIPAGFGSIIEDFEAEAEEVDHEEKFKKLIDNVDVSDARWNQRVRRRQVEVSLRECLIEVLREWHYKFLNALDDLVETKVTEAVIESSKRRCAIKSIVYNFSTAEVSKDVIEALNKGGNYVLHNHQEDESQARAKFEKELLQYLNGYRRFIERNRQVMTTDISEWLEEAQKDSEEHHMEFYKEMMNYKNVMFSKRFNGPSDKYNFKDLDDQGLVVIENDKNSGISILNVSDLIEADRKMVEELGGTKCDENDGAQVKMKIKESIDEFETELSPESKKFMGTYYPDRKGCINDSILPFLKLKAKGHKMGK